MTSFSVRVPFVGEAVSVFKTVSDLFSYGDFDSEKITKISDDTTSFSFPVTLGVFRLLLDGECVLVDRDFDSHVSLMSVTSRDRGGKGKMDARIRLSLDESLESSVVVCECDVDTKGMLARVALPIADVMTGKIQATLSKIIKESEKTIVIDSFVEANRSLGIDDVGSILNVVTPESLDTQAIVSLIEGGNLRLEQMRDRPLWVAILQFPAAVISYPLSVLRALFASIFAH